eukprot:4328405-Alexandrium_andersonii.AAC.1
MRPSGVPGTHFEAVLGSAQFKLRAPEHRRRAFSGLRISRWVPCNGKNPTEATFGLVIAGRAGSRSGGRAARPALGRQSRDRSTPWFGR